MADADFSFWVLNQQPLWHHYLSEGPEWSAWEEMADMLYFDGALGLALFCLWIFCVVDVIVSDEYACRNLPKIAWLLLVIFVPDIGGILWLVVGRPHSPSSAAGSVGRGSSSRFPEYDRPGRHIAADTEDDAEFLRQCRARAEEQRRLARERRRQAEEQ